MKLTKKTVLAARLKELKAMALAGLNATRAADGFKPLRSMPPLWWKMYGGQWMSKLCPRCGCSPCENPERCQSAYE